MKRRIAFMVIMFICICAFITGCRENKAGKQEHSRMQKIFEAQGLSGFVNRSTTYPYHASKEREQFLRNAFLQMRKANNVEDAVKPLYCG